MDVAQNDRVPEWAPPRLVELDLDMTKVENGNAAGNDGNGGFNTSLAS